MSARKKYEKQAKKIAGAPPWDELSEKMKAVWETPAERKRREPTPMKYQELTDETKLDTLRTRIRDLELRHFSLELDGWRGTAEQQKNLDAEHETLVAKLKSLEKEPDA